MTDNDIKKALEYCSYGSEFKCQECPANDCSLSCGSKLAKQALDLINRQQAEIERLQKDNEYILMQHKFDRRPNGDCWNDVIEKAKSEAIKKFWKRFDKVLCENIGPSKRVYWKISLDGDNLVKEMTESPTKIEHSSLCETESFKFATDENGILTIVGEPKRLTRKECLEIARRMTLNDKR